MSESWFIWNYRFKKAKISFYLRKFCRPSELHSAWPWNSDSHRIFKINWYNLSNIYKNLLQYSYFCSSIAKPYLVMFNKSHSYEMLFQKIWSRRCIWWNVIHWGRGHLVQFLQIINHRCETYWGINNLTKIRETNLII